MHVGILLRSELRKSSRVLVRATDIIIAVGRTTNEVCMKAPDELFLCSVTVTQDVPRCEHYRSHLRHREPYRACAWGHGRSGRMGRRRHLNNRQGWQAKARLVSHAGENQSLVVHDSCVFSSYICECMLLRMRAHPPTQEITEPENIANFFNEYFTNIASQYTSDSPRHTATTTTTHTSQIFCQ